MDLKLKTDRLEYISENYPTTLLRAIYVRNYTRLKEILGPYNVTPSQWRVLANLNEYDGQNVNSLAERSYTDRTNLSRSVAIMETEGLVVRRRETIDQRNVLVFMTKKGYAKFAQVLPLVLEEIDFVLEGLTEIEINTFMQLLRKVKNNSFKIWRPNN